MPLEPPKAAENLLHLHTVLHTCSWILSTPTELAAGFCSQTAGSPRWWPRGCSPAVSPPEGTVFCDLGKRSRKPSCPAFIMFSLSIMAVKYTNHSCYNMMECCFSVETFLKRFMKSFWGCLLKYLWRLKVLCSVNFSKGVYTVTMSALGVGERVLTVLVLVNC